MPILPKDDLQLALEHFWSPGYLLAADLAGSVGDFYPSKLLFSPGTLFSHRNQTLNTLTPNLPMQRGII